MPLCPAFWERIGASDVVIDWVTHGITIPFARVPEQPSVFNNPPFKSNESSFIRSELHKLLSNGVVECVSEMPRCVSPLKVVPKKSGKFRLICDLRYINEHCVIPHFSSEDVSILPQIMGTHDRAVTLDLRDGFYHFSIHPDFRTYLGFQFEGRWYVWCRLPFGWSGSPYYFHKCIRVIIEYLRGVHHMSLMAFVDDFLLTGYQSDILAKLQILLDTLSQLGLTVNHEKSVLRPSDVVTYLGFVVRCAGPDGPPVITVPKSKVSKLKQDITRALKRSRISARLLARFAGRCISMLAAVFPCKLKLRNVYRLLNSRHSWEASLEWSPGAVEDLTWWVQSLDSWNGRLLLPPAQFDLQLLTDASESGWGAVLGPPAGRTASGFWCPTVSSESSNFRELFAVYLALLSFQSSLAGNKVEILSDNVTAVALINKFGSSDPRLDAIAQAIWSFALQHNMMLAAHHISGICNVESDALSRQPLRHEWFLHPAVFRQLERMFGPHSIDRFASVTTALLPVYNSRFDDPGSAGVDALGQSDWGQHMNFVNPPFRLIPRVLDLVEAQRAEATLIAPLWPGQPWMTRLRRLCVAPPIRLPPVKRTCIPVLPLQVIEPHRNTAWTLCAWRISGALG